MKIVLNYQSRIKKLTNIYIYFKRTYFILNLKEH